MLYPVSQRTIARSGMLVRMRLTGINTARRAAQVNDKAASVTTMVDQFSLARETTKANDHTGRKIAGQPRMSSKRKGERWIFPAVPSCIYEGSKEQGAIYVVFFTGKEETTYSDLTNPRYESPPLVSTINIVPIRQQGH